MCTFIIHSCSLTNRCACWGLTLCFELNTDNTPLSFQIKPSVCLRLRKKLIIPGLAVSGSVVKLFQTPLRILWGLSSDVLPSESALTSGVEGWVRRACFRLHGVQSILICAKVGGYFHCSEYNKTWQRKNWPEFSETPHMSLNAWLQCVIWGQEYGSGYIIQ